jgi:hypothetical protein
MAEEQANELFSTHVDLSEAVSDELLDASELHKETQRVRVEESLAAIPGVITARIVPGFERAVDELHVLASTGRPPKTVVRDVTSMLFARYGLSIDHRVVSVVQIERRDRALGGAPRPAIERVVATQEGLSTTLTVDLSLEGEAFRGDAEGPSSAAGSQRATARAALAAVRPLLVRDAVVEIEGVDIATVAGREVAIALVHFHTNRGERTVAGSAVLMADENVAIARAVLDAVNRSIVSTSESGAS